MTRSAILLAVLVMLALGATPLPVDAQSPTHVTGGGTGSFGADLDGDGRIDGSQFGIGAVLRAGGAASGHFTCLMAGRSQILGLHLMAVQGRVTQGAINPDGSATLRGTATVNLASGQQFRSVPFVVTVTAGGAGVGTIQLTVIGAFDGVPGDTAPGNGNYDLPVETVRSGQIAIH